MFMADRLLSVSDALDTHYDHSSQELNNDNTFENLEIVWARKRYNPLDLRMSVPVPRYNMALYHLPKAGHSDWLPLVDFSLKSYVQENTGKIFASYPNTRCEQWSTLRQMLPCKGAAIKVVQPNWHLRQGTPPIMCSRPSTSAPKVNSCMTRYNRIA